MAGLQQFVGSWQETEKEGFEEMATALGKSNLSFFKIIFPIKFVSFLQKINKIKNF